MRKILFALSFFTVFNGFSQAESVKICKSVDEFTDETKLTVSDYIVIYEDGGNMTNEGMVITLFLRKGKKNSIDLGSFYVRIEGGEGCVDTNSTLDVIFENGEKTRLLNWNEFDCSGDNYFRLSKKNIALFKSSKVKAIKYTNSRNYDTMVIKENIEGMSSFLMDILLEVDKINSGELIVGLCKE